MINVLVMFSGDLCTFEGTWQGFIADLAVYMRFYAAHGVWRSPVDPARCGCFTFSMPEDRLGALQDDLRVLASAYTFGNIGLLTGIAERIEPMSYGLAAP